MANLPTFWSLQVTRSQYSALSDRVIHYTVPTYYLGTIAVTSSIWKRCFVLASIDTTEHRRILQEFVGTEGAVAPVSLHTVRAVASEAFAAATIRLRTFSFAKPQS